MPARRLRVHPEAEDDINDGLFYLPRSWTAAERFLAAVENGIGLIREFPLRWPALRGGVRRYVLPVFPYSIVYRTSDDEVQVIAVAHAKRRPAYWRKRRF